MINIKNEYGSRKYLITANEMMILISILNLIFFISTSSFALNPSIASICAQGLIGINILFLVVFVGNNFRHAQKDFIIFLLLLLSLLLSYIVSLQSGLKDLFITASAYLSVPIYMLVIPHINLKVKTFEWFKKIGICYALFFIVAYLYKPVYHTFSGALTFGFSNSNTAGMYLYLTSIFILMAFRDSSKKYEKFFSYGIVVILDYLIAQTQCRTAFLLTTFCLICAVFPSLFRPKNRFAVACVVSPVVFYYLYSFLYKISWNLDLTILGRTIYSGRQDMFAIEGIKLSLLGNYVHHFAGLNTAAVLINAVGILGFAIFIIYSILFLTSSFIQRADSNRCNLKLICVGTIFIYGCVESALFTGGSVFAGMIGCILASIKDKKIENI